MWSKTVFVDRYIFKNQSTVEKPNYCKKNRCLSTIRKITRQGLKLRFNFSRILMVEFISKKYANYQIPLKLSFEEPFRYTSLRALIAYKATLFFLL